MIDRRSFVAALGGMWCVPSGAAAPAVKEPHFPDRLHLFVWRNWELIPTDRMAGVVRSKPAEIQAVGRSMGLPAKREPNSEQLRRTYITVIRQNWHVLPNDQLVELLGWSPEKFAFTLKEDDFLDVKLGAKPQIERLVYIEPDQAARSRARWIRRTLKETLGKDLSLPGEAPLTFIDRLSQSPRQGELPAMDPRRPVFQPRYLYSYFALYGDPLLEPDLDPFPDGYLERLAALDINGVWMQCLLSTMTVSQRFPEFGRGAEERLRNLERLSERLDRKGVRLYLYLNEPRAQTAEFFRDRLRLKGAESRGLYAMCTSQPEVREWVRDGVASIFHRAPGLGGVFSITMSENLTNCFSHSHPERCPRCSKRKSWEAVGEVLEAIREGVRSASKKAEVIAYDWAWPDDMCRNLIPKMPKDSRLLSVSEWSQPVDRGGVKSEVGEYSISVVGPGPRAARNWRLARTAEVRVIAKTQFNNTWEISAVPYIPAAHLVARHCANLVKEGISGFMASWTLGGYPSPNLEVAREFYYSPPPTVEQALERVAARRYGKRAGPGVVEAWKGFSDAFEEFPYGVSVYLIPTQHGPANLLRTRPTGTAASMILFPQDDYKRWKGAYPAEVARDQFRKLAEGWERALEIFRKAVDLGSEDFAVAEACGIHFRSAANQMEFYLLRDSNGSPERMKEIARSEMELARRLYRLARRHSVIGYEASNHYYYRPLDLAEKVLNCRYLLEMKS